MADEVEPSISHWRRLAYPAAGRKLWDKVIWGVINFLILRSLNLKFPLKLFDLTENEKMMF